MMDWVRAIEGRSSDGRRAFILSHLDSLGIRTVRMPFDTAISHDGRTRHISGENIIVRMGTGDPTLVVGAHYDAVEISPGANDNGGGVAVVMMLAAELRRHAWRGTIDFVFFDQEEVGLVGSGFYVRRRVEKNRHHAMVNLDVVGTGEVLFVGPVGGGDDDRLMPSVRRAAAKAGGLPLDERAWYPGSDHLSFAQEGLENISVSVMPEGVVDQLEAMMRGGAGGGKPLPEVLSVMHTPNDSSSLMSGQALQMAYTLVKETLLDLDARLR